MSTSASPSRVHSRPSLATSSTSQPTSDRRLFVGNLHPGVDEYALVKVFSPHGHITKLDIVFHKTGALKGKPRGYAFVEYSKPQDAQKAGEATNGKTLRGRELRVSFANVNEQEESGLGPHRRTGAQVDPQKPTPLSLIKKSQRPDSTDARIAAMEAKLTSLRKKSTPEGDPSSRSASPLTGHPSLPKKPAR